MITDVAAQNASLDNDYGPTHGPHAPASHELALLAADGTELDPATSPGYARVTIPQASWPAAAGALKELSVQFPAPAGAWTPAVSWQLYGADGYAWDGDNFADPLLVTTESDTGPVVVLGIYYSPDI